MKFPVIFRFPTFNNCKLNLHVFFPRFFLSFWCHFNSPNAARAYPQNRLFCFRRLLSAVNNQHGFEVKTNTPKKRVFIVLRCSQSTSRCPNSLQSQAEPMRQVSPRFCLVSISLSTRKISCLIVKIAHIRGWG